MKRARFTVEAIKFFGTELPVESTGCACEFLQEGGGRIGIGGNYDLLCHYP